MPDRKSLVSTLWLTSPLALLAMVLFAPIRTSGSVTDSSRPDCPSRHLALSGIRPTPHLGAAMGADAAPQVNVFRFEDDEQDRADALENEEQDRADALDQPRVIFLLPCSFRKIPDRRLIPPLSILSHYPLRC